MLTIKGTDKNMQCRGFQYELGKTYKMNEEPKLCERGFHACLNPYGALKYYKSKYGKRFFVVKLDGTITECDKFYTTVASNEITFIREVTVDDFPQLFDEFLKDKERLSKLNFQNGFCRVEMDEKWNFINANGELISNQWFDDCDDFHEGLATVKLGGKWNSIKPNGEYISKQWFGLCVSFEEGFSCIKINGKWNFINTKGEVISEQWFDWCNDFQGGFGAVKLNGKWNFINTKGELISDQWFDSCGGFINDTALVVNDNKFNWVNKHGELLSIEWIKTDFYESDVMPINVDGRKICINTKGQLLHPDFLPEGVIELKDYNKYCK